MSARQSEAAPRDRKGRVPRERPRPQNRAADSAAGAPTKTTSRPQTPTWSGGGDTSWGPRLGRIAGDRAPPTRVRRGTNSIRTMLGSCPPPRQREMRRRSRKTRGVKRLAAPSGCGMSPLRGCALLRDDDLRGHTERPHPPAIKFNKCKLDLSNVETY